MDPTEPRRLLVSDFDGTMTDRDFYKVYRERFFPADALDPWEDYKAGKISHFEGLRRIFGYAAPGEEALIGLTREMGLDPELKPSLERLDAAGWDVAVVSAGCGWYIDHLLREAGVDLVVHTNPGRVEGGRLLMERPEGTEYPSDDVGVDKAAVVRRAVEGGRTVAFAGDGLPDAPAARLVPEELRFAREELAEALRGRGEGFRPFRRWSEVARALCEWSEGR